MAHEHGQIQSVPRRFLDPRRPKQKPTAEEMEEWLIQYDPVIPDDPKRVLSHNYQVSFCSFPCTRDTSSPSRMRRWQRRAVS